MALRDPIKSHEEQKAARKVELEAERARAVDLASEVFSTPDGYELLQHLCRKFHYNGPVFLTADASAPACPYAAAKRDGEKQPLRYLIELCRAADPKFPIP